MTNIPQDPIEYLIRSSFPPALADALSEMITASEAAGHIGDVASSEQQEQKVCNRQVEALRKLIEEMHDPNYFNHPNPATGKKNAVPRSL